MVVKMTSVSETTVVRAAGAVDEVRLWQRHMAMAEIGATPKGGVNRQALTHEDNQARALLAGWATELGFDCSMDDVGNMFIRRRGTDPHAAPVMTGSHIDSQPSGGRFDGIYGVLAALEALQAIDEAGIATHRPLEAVVWTNEEGTRFVHSLMGSEAYMDPSRLDSILAVSDDAGITVAEALQATRKALPSVPHRTLGGTPAVFIEAHIEQGPILEEKGLPVGIVTGIQGWRRFMVEVEGEDGHAGTLPHKLRKDALLAATAMVGALEKLMHDPDDVVRFTVGRFVVSPNSLAVIPGRVSFTVDFRHPEEDMLAERSAQVEPICRANARSCDVTVKEISRQSPIHFEGPVADAIETVTERLDIPYMKIYSGAGHDAQHLFRLCPTGMIFVPCEKGISHNEAENAKPSDLAAGTRVLAGTLVELANQ